ncbi:MAG: hypothetical protein N2645_15200 [Clostridia bacterium]|nr:hypothetical protein [Clostridia bacterium]
MSVFFGGKRTAPVPHYSRAWGMAPGTLEVYQTDFCPTFVAVVKWGSGGIVNKNS